jgi:hypothetical protein
MTNIVQSWRSNLAGRATDSGGPTDMLEQGNDPLVAPRPAIVRGEQRRFFIAGQWKKAPAFDMRSQLAFELWSDRYETRFEELRIADSDDLLGEIHVVQDQAKRFTDAHTTTVKQQSRPHGVLIARVEGAGGVALRTLVGETIAVRGRIAVFGERPGTAREGPEERAARAPYLAACVLGRAAPDAPPEVLSAYLHPCVSEEHLMLIDSDMERQTFAQLRSAQAWLGKRNLARVSIEKPLFDLWPEDHGNAHADPRPPCLPDFVVRAIGADAVARAAVIETMGSTDAAYRQRKERSHALMSLALGGAPVIMHDFQEPAGRSQKDRDGDFWRAVRGRVAGALQRGQHASQHERAGVR